MQAVALRQSAPPSPSSSNRAAAFTRVGKLISYSKREGPCSLPTAPGGPGFFLIGQFPDIPFGGKKTSIRRQAARSAAASCAEDEEERDFMPKRRVMIVEDEALIVEDMARTCLLYTSPSPRDATLSRMPSSA